MARFYVYDGSKYVLAGADGKSAYQYAQEGGYTGTEEEFAEKLAQEQLDGTTLTLTPTQVYDAMSAGIPVKVQYTDSKYGLLSFTEFNVAESLNVIVSQTIVYSTGAYILVILIGNKFNNIWGFYTTTLQTSSITDTGGYFTTDTVEGALQEIGAELAGINTLLGSGIQISFTIEDAHCTANAGQTFSEWIGSGYKTLENGMMLSVPYGDDGVIFLDEAGVYALSLDGNTPVHGGDKIISGGTYVSMNWGG